MTIDPLSVLGLGFEGIEKIHNLIKSKIVIKPKSFSSSPNNWNTVRPVIVSNQTENPLFDIQIVLWSTGANPKIEITIEDQEKGHNEYVGSSVDINTDSFIVKGIANGKNFILIQLSYLQPKSGKRIFIKPAGAVDTKLEIVKFSTEPSALATKENGVSIPFTPPFNMSVKSISLLLKRRI